MPGKRCRYLVGGDCVYWETKLTPGEQAKCAPGGWDCYEEDSEGAIYHDGRWMTIEEYIEFHNIIPVWEELDGEA
jgi:hypothetical protein